MSLLEQKFFVNFSKGVDSGRDPKTVIPSKFTKLDNLEWDKFQTVRQRPGYAASTITAHTGSATVANARQLHVLGAEVILEAASGFHAFAQDRTINRDKTGLSDALIPLERTRIDYIDIVAEAQQVVEVDAAAASPSGLECWAWNEIVKIAATDVSVVKYQIVDGKTRAIIQGGTVAGSATLSAYHPRVLVRDDTNSTFYIYYATWDGATDYKICLKSLTVSAGQKVPGAISSQSVVVTGLSPTSAVDVPFDAWLDLTEEVIVLAFEDAAGDLVVDIIDITNGVTVLSTATKTVAAAVDTLSVTVVRSSGVSRAFVAYADTGAAIIAFSVLLDGSSPVTTTLTTGGTSNGFSSGRIAAMASPFVDNQAFVFYDTTYTTGAYDPFFTANVGFVRCTASGATPAVESLFVRGVALAARPVSYTAGGVTSICVTTKLMSTIQPTIFMLRFGVAANAVSGFGTVAAGNHVPPRVLARVLPGEIASFYTPGPRSRLSSALAIV